VSPTAEPVGLDSREAAARLALHGPNAVPEEHRHPLGRFLRKLWGPVPWMLELTLVLQLVLGKQTDAAIIGALLVFNAGLGFAQERRAEGALALLRERLVVRARVRRDGRWQLLPAEVLVPGDVVRLRVGDFVPADVRAVEGEAAVDRSALTGESVPVEVGPGDTLHAGSVVRRGEITGEVTATGARTFYGRTAQLVKTARSASQLESLILSIVEYLVVLDTALVAVVLAFALRAGMPLGDVLPFALILLVASVPVALPTTFTLAEAIGAVELAARGVLVTRLSAVEEAAAMDVLCSDKTGTITRNELSVAGLHAIPPYDENALLRLAALASDEATQDPIDLALLAAARARGLAVDDVPRLEFIPFDPATKRSQALVREHGTDLRIVKGTPAAVAPLCAAALEPEAVRRLAAAGARVLAVAAGPPAGLRLVGLVGLADPPREDSSALLAELRRLGIRVLMVTGDAVDTARAVAARVGLGDRVCPVEVLRAGDPRTLLDYDVFAGIYPEDKFRLVKALQQAGHTVGMTGDGVNDAPALKQAEVGIAVANATDVAKAAASMVLTNPGLTDALAAVDVGRQIHARMLTYTLNKIVKTIQVGLFLSLGLVATGVFVTTPHLIVLLLFTNDFATMALATDRVLPAPRPQRWHVRAIVLSALLLASGWLVFSFATFLVGRDGLGLDVPQLQTLVFAMLVMSGQATIYLVRERGRLWASRPSGWLLAASVGDVLAVSLLAILGILMRPLPASTVLGLLVAVAAWALALDALKALAFRRLAAR
jgi:H+-transporting ATPase